MSEHTIASLCVRSHEIAVEKGWVDREKGDSRSYVCISNLFHTELSEAFEEYRTHHGLNYTWYKVEHLEVNHGHRVTSDVAAAELEEFVKAHDTLGVKPVPQGIPIELADFVIRIAQYFRTNGGEEWVMTKLAASVHLAHLEEEWSRDFDSFIAYTHVLVGESVCPFPLGRNNRWDYLCSALANVFNFCEKNNIDIWAAIDEKEAYNRTREYRHGNKKV